MSKNRPVSFRMPDLVCVAILCFPFQHFCWLRHLRWSQTWQLVYVNGWKCQEKNHKEKCKTGKNSIHTQKITIKNTKTCKKLHTYPPPSLFDPPKPSRLASSWASSRAPSTSGQKKPTRPTVNTTFEASKRKKNGSFGPFRSKLNRRRLPLAHKKKVLVGGKRGFHPRKATKTGFDPQQWYVSVTCWNFWQKAPRQ